MAGCNAARVVLSATGIDSYTVMGVSDGWPDSLPPGAVNP